MVLSQFIRVRKCFPKIVRPISRFRGPQYCRAACSPFHRSPSHRFGCSGKNGKVACHLPFRFLRSIHRIVQGSVVCQSESPCLLTNRKSNSHAVSGDGAVGLSSLRSAQNKTALSNLGEPGLPLARCNAANVNGTSNSCPSLFVELSRAHPFSLTTAPTTDCAMKRHHSQLKQRLLGEESKTRQLRARLRPQATAVNHHDSLARHHAEGCVRSTSRSPLASPCATVTLTRIS